MEKSCHFSLTKSIYCPSLFTNNDLFILQNWTLAGSDGEMTPQNFETSMRWQLAAYIQVPKSMADLSVAYSPTMSGFDESPVTKFYLKISIRIQS